jgi:hypothetical protein
MFVGVNYCATVFQRLSSLQIITILDPVRKMVIHVFALLVVLVVGDTLSTITNTRTDVHVPTSSQPLQPLIPAYADCCGGICCDRGHVCVKSWNGPRCWPANPRERALATSQPSIAAFEATVNAATSTSMYIARITTGRAASTYSISTGLPATKTGGPGRSNDGTRTTGPPLLYVLLILVSYAMANVTLNPVTFPLDSAGRPPRLQPDAAAGGERGQSANLGAGVPTAEKIANTQTSG